MTQAVITIFYSYDTGCEGGGWGPRSGGGIGCVRDLGGRGWG